MSTIFERFGNGLQHSDLTNPLAPRYVGLECEIEGVRSHSGVGELGFNVTTDGSLRNNGYEYITNAITIPDAVNAFAKLHTTLQADPTQKFSPRTSIHVHVNCSAYDEEAVRRIIWLYALFEEAFFLMVDPERRDNIHCVPLTETHLPAMYRDTMPRLVDRWSKYTALNIKPLSSYGTLEFRHMHGHDDPVLLQQWLGSINNLFNVAITCSKINADFLKTENLEVVFNKIFGDTKLKNQWVLVRGMMVNQIIDIKLAV